MVETITPVVHGGRARWAPALALHIAGAAASAAIFGALLGALGAALGGPFGAAGLAFVLGLSLLYLVGEVVPGSVPVPQLRRQVPDWWRTFFPAHVAAALYGAGLGVGFLTYLRHGTLVVVSAAAFSSARPALGALVLGVFGVARGASLIVASSVRTAEAGRHLVEALAQRSEGLRRSANAAALGGLAVATVLTLDRVAAGGWGRAAGAVLALVFAWSAATKVVSRRNWERALAGHGFPGRLERVVRSAVPVAEVAVPGLVFAGLVHAAAWWSAAMLLVFSAELVRVRVVRGSRIPCGCWGSRRTIGLPAALIRNVGLGVAVAFAATTPGSARLAWPGVPAGGEILPMVLASVGVAVAGWTSWRASMWLRGAARA